MSNTPITVLEVITDEKDIQELYGPRDPVSNAELKAAEEAVEKTSVELSTIQVKVEKAYELHQEAVDRLTKLRNKSNRNSRDTYYNSRNPVQFARPRRVDDFRDRHEGSRYSQYRNLRHENPVLEKFIDIFEELRNEDSTVFLRANLDYRDIPDALEDLIALPLTKEGSTKAVLDCDNVLFIIVPTDEEHVIFYSNLEYGKVSVHASGKYERLTNENISSIRVLENSFKICS